METTANCPGGTQETNTGDTLEGQHQPPNSEMVATNAAPGGDSKSGNEREPMEVEMSMTAAVNTSG